MAAASSEQIFDLHRQVQDLHRQIEELVASYNKALGILTLLVGAFEGFGVDRRMVEDRESSTFTFDNPVYPTGFMYAVLSAAEQARSLIDSQAGR